MASSDSPSSPVRPLYTIGHVSGKGRGLLAAVDLVRGTELVVEKPTLALDLGKAFDHEAEYDYMSSLTPDELITLCSIETDRPNGHPIAIRLHKLTQVDPFNAQAVVYMPIIGKANHACSPNAVLAWQDRAPRRPIGHLLAITSIPAGSEITISYLAQPMPFNERQQMLRQLPYTFICTCPTCTLSLADRRLQDDKTARLVLFLHAVHQGKRLVPPVSVMRQLASLAMTAVEDGMCLPLLGVLIGLASQVCISGGDEPAARAWAELFVEWAWFVKDMASLGNAVGCLQPRQHPIWATEVQRKAGHTEKLQAPPSVVRRFFATLKLAPTYTPPPLPATAPRATRTLPDPSNGDTPAQPAAHIGEVSATGSLGPAVDLNDHARAAPSNVPPHLRAQLSKSQKKRVKAKQARKSSLSASYVPTPSPKTGTASPTATDSPSVGASPQRPTASNAISSAPPSSLAQRVAPAPSPDAHSTLPQRQGPWRRLSPKERKEEQERAKSARASLVLAQGQTFDVAPVNQPSQPLIAPEPEKETERGVEKSISNKARKRMLAAAEAEEARKKAAEEREAAASLARSASPDPTVVPLPSSPSSASEDELGSPSHPLSTSQKKRLKKRAQRERQRTGASTEPARGAEGKRDSDAIALVGQEEDRQGAEGGPTGAQRKKLKERERRRAVKQAQAAAAGPERTKGDLVNEEEEERAMGSQKDRAGRSGATRVEQETVGAQGVQA